LFEQLGRFVTETAGQAIDAAQIAAIVLPPWLRLNLRVLDSAGREVGRGRDLDTLRRELRASGRAMAAPGAGHAWEREGVRRWDFGDIPDEVSVRVAGVSLRMYPAIEDAGTAARLRLYPSAELARARSRKGVVRLAALAMPQQHEVVRRMCSSDREFALLTATAGLGKSIFDEIADRAVADACHTTDGHDPRTAAEFEARVEAGRARVADCGAEVLRVAKGALLALKDARAALGVLAAPVFVPQCEAVKRQLDELLAPGWARHTPEPWFFQLPKYIRAAGRRLERLRNEVERDRKLQAQVAPFEAALRDLNSGMDPERPSPERERLRWMLEEFRVSLFAQELRTLMPVSAKRLEEQSRLARKEAGRA